VPKLVGASALGAVLGLGLSPLGVEAQEYQVDLTRERRVSFLSDAPLEDFRGVTDRIDGFVYLEGEGLVGGTDLRASEFFFEVDLASLDTGIGLRNRHMRENYLETEDYPFASFSGRVGVLEGLGERRFSAEAVGELEIHGVAVERAIRCQVTTVGSGGRAAETSPGSDATNAPASSEGAPPLILRVQCAFPVSLSDHGIPITKLMFMKIDEVMELELGFHLQAVAEEGK
jgi:polyisoprenoid-binding protein YceI